MRKLREALKPLVGDLSRVVYVSYANPALAGGAPCPGGRAGFDIHPSFNADPQRLANVSGYVQNEFLPQLKALALCQSGVLCRDPASDRMTFVDAHQAAFADHGFCARAETDPEFDRACFSAKGESFDPDIVTAASQPMLCGRGASEYRAYLPRARWIRDANDSYFAAMTYPQGLPSSSQPADIHDATWGVLSAVYGGAVHPTAEGHAAMADAALPAAASVLQLDAPEAAGDVGAGSAAAAACAGRGTRRAARCACAVARASSTRRRRRSAWRPGWRLDRGGLRRQIFLRRSAGSSWAIAVSGSRCQVSSLPNSEMPDIAAHRQRLAIGADGHLGLVDLAVARIEHVAVLVFQSVCASCRG